MRPLVACKRLVVYTLLFLTMFVSQALAQDKNCAGFFGKKEFVKAAECFLKLAKTDKPLATLSKQEKIRVGRSLRNAAVALRAAAISSKKPEEAAYHRERAVTLLKRYIDQKLYESPYRRKSTLGILHIIQKNIHYTPLTIVTNDAKSQVAVEGYKYKASSTGDWSKNVRPGNYRVTVTYEGNPPVTKEFTITPKQAKVVVFKAPAKQIVRRDPPKPKPKPSGVMRILPWIVIGVGAATAVTGAVLLGIAGNADGQKYSIHQSAQSNPTLADTKKIVDLHQQSTSLYPGGWITLVLGLAIAGGGAGLLLLRKKPAKDTTKTEPPASTTPPTSTTPPPRATPPAKTTPPTRSTPPPSGTTPPPKKSTLPIHLHISLP